MKENISPLHRFAEQLESFRYVGGEDPPDVHAAYLEAFRDGLPSQPDNPLRCEAAKLRSHLDGAGARVRETLKPYLQEQLSALAIENLKVTHSFQTLFAHSRLIDAFHRFAFAVAAGELPLLVRLREVDTREELARKSERIPRKEIEVSQLERELSSSPADGDSNIGAEDAGAASQREYYQGLARAIGESLISLKAAVASLEGMVEDLSHWDEKRLDAGEALVLFARGGYGRAEMSFSSDLDIGYCLETKDLRPGEIAVFQDLVMRVESLLHDCGMDTVHQYFELEEDLSRFTETEALHTFPAILEARPIAGNTSILTGLKARFKALLPFEAVSRQKSEEFSRQTLTGLTAMNLKEDAGGLRSIQIPLWLLGITHNASSFMTMDLLQLARRKNLLSLWEVSHLLQAVEFLYELRNFTGAAESHYYDREARESGFLVHSFAANRIDDQLTRLYLFRKQRFTSLDAFDAFRLRLVAEVRRITGLLMERVLNRTLTHGLETLRVEVHLGEKQIISIQSLLHDGSADMPSLLRAPAAVLELFTYLAESNFDLSPELKDGLTAVVMGMTQPETGFKAGLAAGFGRLLSAPYAHRAMRTLMQITDPLSPGMPTLLGRFIPEADRMQHLVRRFDGTTMSLHEHTLRSLEQGQAVLERLRGDHRDLFDLLGEGDVLALKWSLFLHDIARTAHADAAPAQSAEQAVEILAGLEYQDARLEEKVRLLISHHRAMAALSRMATYMDQALAQYFEIAGRDMVNATLLFLVNLAVLQARGEDAGGDVGLLQALFKEANHIWGEMQGFPVRERSLEAINIYFERKKEELFGETRLHLLFLESITHGLGKAVFDPLAASHPEVWERVAPAAGSLEETHKEIVLGALDRTEQAGRETKLVRTLRNLLGMETVEALTAGHEDLLQWFFAAFPNRYLISAFPSALAAQLKKFAAFRTAQVIADLVPGVNNANQGLLIYTRGLNLSHSRVAYALSRLRLDITTGKVNRVNLEHGGHGYCYFFQFNPLEPGAPLRPADLERMITEGEPPELRFPEAAPALAPRKARVIFQGNDQKGYLIHSREGKFQRVPAEYAHIKMTLRDAPFLFYKLTRAFDLYEVEVQQALITTTGKQVVDYFYLTPEDYARLRASDFVERLMDLVDSNLMALVR